MTSCDQYEFSSMKINKYIADGKTVRFEPMSLFNHCKYNWDNHKYDIIDPNTSFKFINKRKKSVRNTTCIRATTWLSKSPNAFWPGDRKKNNKKAHNMTKLLLKYDSDIIN